MSVIAKNKGLYSHENPSDAVGIFKDLLTFLDFGFKAVIHYRESNFIYRKNQFQSFKIFFKIKSVEMVVDMSEEGV